MFGRGSTGLSGFALKASESITAECVLSAFIMLFVVFVFTFLPLRMASRSALSLAESVFVCAAAPVPRAAIKSTVNVMFFMLYQLGDTDTTVCLMACFTKLSVNPACNLFFTAPFPVPARHYLRLYDNPFPLDECHL